MNQDTIIALLMAGIVLIMLFVDIPANNIKTIEIIIGMLATKWGTESIK
jgi:hypothetical protein